MEIHSRAFKKLFLKVQKCTNVHFCTFYLTFALVDFYFLTKKCASFSKGSRSLCSAPSLNFGQKCTFWPIFRSKCREMSDHCHGFKLRFWPKSTLFGLCTLRFKSTFLHFLKKGGAKVVHCFMCKSTKVKKWKKAHGPRVLSYWAKGA